MSKVLKKLLVLGSVAVAIGSVLVFLDKKKKLAEPLFEEEDSTEEVNEQSTTSSETDLCSNQPARGYINLV